MIALAGTLTGQPSVVAAAPAAVLAAVLWSWPGDGLPHPAAGRAGAGVWLVLATLTHDDTVLVPLGMVAPCVAFAIGPGRAYAWLVAQWMRDGAQEVPMMTEPDREPGWIAEYGRRV